MCEFCIERDLLEICKHSGRSFPFVLPAKMRAEGRKKKRETGSKRDILARVPTSLGEKKKLREKLMK